MTRFVALSLVVFPLAFAAAGCCGKSDPGGDAASLGSTSAGAKPTAAATAAGDDGHVLFSCNEPKDHVCMQWDDLKLTEVNDARKSCGDPGEVFKASGCPLQNALATCKVKAKEDEPAMTSVIYRAAEMDMAGAREFCKAMEGTLTPVAASGAAPAASKK